MDNFTDTIVASATPPGVGGVGIVRLSGKLTESIARNILGTLPEPRMATYKSFRDKSGQRIDSGLVLYFPAPLSFTGESVLEIQGHGGPYLQTLIIDTILDLGARYAKPGEFSQRAFLNGKLDLVQAESISDLINAGTNQAARAAFRSLTGVFSNYIDVLSNKLLKLRIHIEAAIDFPEEEINFLSDKLLLNRIADCEEVFSDLLKKTEQGTLLRDGFQVVIIGKPNVGKSSLLNFLSEQDSAIVTEVAGTTRDILRERINIDGLAVELIDTAGLRDNPEIVEAEGIRRAHKVMKTADALIIVEDITDPNSALNANQIPSGLPTIHVQNKLDLCKVKSKAIENHIQISATTGEGIKQLRHQIRMIAGYENQGEGAFTARKRHIQSLKQAASHFYNGKKVFYEKHAGELLAEELRLSHQALGEIVGTVSSDDLLGHIFSDFCIGK